MSDHIAFSDTTAVGVRKVLLLGAGGQLGSELRGSQPETGVELVAAGRGQLDLADAGITQAIVELAPDVVINAAAYTAVDRAESEAEHCHLINDTAVGRVAEAVNSAGARLIHVSTDFVFDGRQSHPYRPDDGVNPLGVYGESKWRGEQAVRSVLGDAAVILRTAWVYSAHGNNFVKTMLRLMGERDQLGVVADQIGTPTWAGGLARAIWRIVEAPNVQGTHHWTDAGAASWYDFAVAIYEEGRRLGLLQRDVHVAPIPTEAYPTPASRPAYSVLDKQSLWDALQIEGVHWRQQLTIMLQELKESIDV